MPSTVWKGSLSFGLVNIPIGLYSATSDRTLRFHQFERGTADRVRNKRVNERTGDEVSYGDIVKGYDLGGGDYVLLEPEELDAAAPERSRTIEITGFVDQSDIDPIYYRSTYYLAPDGEAAERAYALLRQAMLEEDKVAVATFVMRNKEYLVCVRPTAEVLALETMYFADEIREPTRELPNLPEAGGFTDREQSTAQLLLESMTRSWDPGEYHDTYRERVEEIVARKREGEEVVSEAAPAEPSPVVDLMEALQASIRRARGEGEEEMAEAASGGGSSGRSSTPGQVRRAATGATKEGRTPAGRKAGGRGRSSSHATRSAKSTKSTKSTKATKSAAATKGRRSAKANGAAKAPTARRRAS